MIHENIGQHFNPEFFKTNKMLSSSIFENIDCQMPIFFLIACVCV